MRFRRRIELLCSDTFNARRVPQAFLVLFEATFLVFLTAAAWTRLIPSHAGDGPPHVGAVGDKPPLSSTIPKPVKNRLFGNCHDHIFEAAFRNQYFRPFGVTRKR